MNLMCRIEIKHEGKFVCSSEFAISKKNLPSRTDFDEIPRFIPYGETTEFCFMGYTFTPDVRPTHVLREESREGD